MAAYFKTDAAAYTVDELAQYYRGRNVAAVTFTVDVKDRPVRPVRPRAALVLRPRYTRCHTGASMRVEGMRRVAAAGGG